MKRQYGYYWCRVNRRGVIEWEIAEWTTRDAWKIMQHSADVPENDKQAECSIEEINEKRVTSLTINEAAKYGIEINKMSDEDWWKAYFKQKLPWTFDKWFELYHPDKKLEKIHQPELSGYTIEWRQYLHSVGY